MKKTTETQQCDSVYDGDSCELPKFHRYKHRRGGSMWTDGGLERLRKEREAAITAKSSEKP